MKRKKKILITGSNGFIGKNLKNELKNRYDIYGIGRKDLNEKNYFKINLKNKKDIDKLFLENKFDIVIHCAWYTKHSSYRNSKINFKYLEYSKYLLDTYIKNGGENFIGIGTCEEYKKKTNSKNLFLEKSKIDPINIYAKTKNLFNIYLKEKKINYKWLRIFYLFGEGEYKKRLFPLIIKNQKKKIKLRNPFFRIDFLHIKIVTKIISKLINKKISGEFNICSGKTIKLMDLIDSNSKKNIKLVNKKYRYEEIKGSVDKLKKYKCYIPFNLKENLVKYIQSNKNTSP